MKMALLTSPRYSPKSHRSRLLEGMAHVVSRKGFAEVTIADVVAEAGVSRRTFYESFETKAECLIALYEAASHNAVKLMRSSIDPAQDWHGQVQGALRAYLGCLASNPVLLRTLFIEILHLAPMGLAARRRVNNELAKFILKTVNVNGAATLTPVLAMAIVGAINELVLDYIERNKAAKLEELVAPASRLVLLIASAV